jgi:hypothetical protein
VNFLPPANNVIRVSILTFPAVLHSTTYLINLPKDTTYLILGRVYQIQAEGTGSKCVVENPGNPEIREIQEILGVRPELSGLMESQIPTNEQSVLFDNHIIKNATIPEN